LTGDGEPERVNGELVSADYFTLLGLQASRGRTFLPEEDRAPSGHRIALIGNGLWQRRFGGDPALVGQTIRLNALDFTVVGIIPDGFQGLSDQAEIWLPIKMAPTIIDPDALGARDYRLFSVVSRLKPGITQPQAHAEIETIAGRLEKAYPESNTNRGARVILLHEQLLGNLQRTLWILFGAVGCVLLVACANVANLQLQQASIRSMEMAVRRALGATPRRLIQQLLTESLMLSLVGGVLGVSLAWLSVDLLIKLSPMTFPGFVNLTVDARVLGFSLLISLLTGVIFGLTPALQVSKYELTETLKTGGHNGSGGLGRNRLLSSIVILEIVMALTLLIGAGLMIRSLYRLQAVDPGFNTEKLLTMRVSLPEEDYGRDRIAAFSRQVIERFRALPGVQSVTVSSDLPLSGGGSGGPIELEGINFSSGFEETIVYRHRVTFGYFSTLGIPLIAGRDFNADDQAKSPGVAVISEAMARRYWPNESPIGKRLREDNHGVGAADPWRTIVGVVGDVKYRGLRQNLDGYPDVYFPWLQAPNKNLYLAVRSNIDSYRQVSALRNELKKLDPQLPVYGVTTMEQQMTNQTRQSRFSAWLLGAFGAIALVLAAVGIYSVMSYAVEQRRREIGIRMAFGAGQGDILKMVIVQGMRLALIGVVAGIGVALVLTRLIRQLLFGVGAIDLLTYGVIAAALIMIALLACWVPARRATRVDPMTAQRCE
jgi:putative ABC transport system permease protein